MVEDLVGCPLRQLQGLYIYTIESQKKNYFSLVHWKLRYGLAQLASLVTLQREMQCIEYGPIVGVLG